MVHMPTPVGPLGPDEIDPNDPDLWDWSGDYDDDDARPRQAPWIRITAWVIAIVLAIALVASLLR
jgi:hypothetical protein